MTQTRTTTPSTAGSSTAAVPVRRRRSLGDRLTVNVVVAALAGLLAFVSIAVVLRDRREMVTVAVATKRIPAGVEVTPEMVRAEQMPKAVGFSGSLVAFDAVNAGGLVASRTIQPGEAIPLTATGSLGVGTGARVMSIPVKSWQAAGGEVEIGDLIDVIDTSTDSPSYVLMSAAVVGRNNDSSGGGLASAGRSSDLTITVEVTDTQALSIAKVIQSGKLLVVRSTGAPAPATVQVTVPVTVVAAPATQQVATTVAGAGG